MVNSYANKTGWQLFFMIDLSLKENEGMSVTVSFSSFTFLVHKIHVNDHIYFDYMAKFKLQFLATCS